MELNLQDILDPITKYEKFLLVTHEHPDGDALGSIAGLAHGLEQLGKDYCLLIDAKDQELPNEYRFLALNHVVSQLPSDLHDRVIIFLDCGNIDRTPFDLVNDRTVLPVINIDHHHDNTCFAAVNYVDADASSTAEIVWLLLEQASVELTLHIAEALYVGLITDTGRFMYRGTTPRAHQMAARLIEKTDLDTQKIYRQVYESVPYPRLKLLGKALANVSRYDEGTVTLTYITQEDLSFAGAVEHDSEGIVDHLRAVSGTEVAVLIRERLADTERGRYKVSLRARSEHVDVSSIAREYGGGGHRQAAGFSSDSSIEELITGIRSKTQDYLAGKQANES